MKGQITVVLWTNINGFYGDFYDTAVFHVVNQGVELPKVLQTDFNMSTAFSETKANFRQMTDVLIKIDKIVHKAFIRVDEEGTEAAAVSGSVNNQWIPAANVPTDSRITMVDIY